VFDQAVVTARLDVDLTSGMSQHEQRGSPGPKLTLPSLAEAAHLRAPSRQASSPIASPVREDGPKALSIAKALLATEKSISR